MCSSAPESRAPQKTPLTEESLPDSAYTDTPVPQSLLFEDNLPEGSRLALASSGVLTIVGAAIPFLLSQMNGAPLEEYGSHYAMLALLFGFGAAHSGLASLRPLGADVLGERLYRVLFVGVSLPTAGLAIAFFIAHRYDGPQLWALQGTPWIRALVVAMTAVSFALLYPATFDLAQVAAIKKPRLTIFERGVTRITRHPQLWGQIIWCAAHSLWLGSSFALVASCGLVAHHLFGVWNGDRRLRDRFGDEWQAYALRTSILPFGAVLDGRQTLDWREFATPAYAGIALFVWAGYKSHPAILRIVGELHL